MVVFSDKYYVNLTVKENALTFHIQIKEEVSRPMVLTEIYLKSPDTGEYDFELMNRTIDGCKFLSNKLYEPLMQIAFQIVQAHGDIPTSCPIKMVMQ